MGLPVFCVGFGGLGFGVGRAVQVPKQGRDLHRESAFCMALMAQVPALKLNLRHLCRDLRGKFSYIKIIETTKLWQGLPKYGFA